jgi:hypothetical protein
MTQQSILPLEFSSKPVQVVVKVDDLSYRFGPFSSETRAAELMATLARLLGDQFGVEFHKSSGSWFGAQDAPEAGKMWTIFPSQQY